MNHLLKVYNHHCDFTAWLNVCKSCYCSLTRAAFTAWVFCGRLQLRALTPSQQRSSCLCCCLVVVAAVASPQTLCTPTLLIISFAFLSSSTLDFFDERCDRLITHLAFLKNRRWRQFPQSPKEGSQTWQSEPPPVSQLREKPRETRTPVCFSSHVFCFKN